MTNADETYEDDYSEYDEFDDGDDGGLSGFSVLLIGLVMFGAFLAITWIAYHQGIKRGEDGAGETPYVAADPEPIKIETADNGAPAADREVYDVFDGDNADPATVLAEGPEEPVERGAEDPIAALAADAGDDLAETSQAVEDRIASLAEEDAGAFDADPGLEVPDPVAAAAPIEVAATPEPGTPSRARGALSGGYVVQVGAFRSDDEARGQWARMQSKLGDFVAGKSIDVETADLGDRGVYHRLRVGPFSSSDEAKQYCAGLKERGQDCLIKSI
jgi:cell division septation protein DedD